MTLTRAEIGDVAAELEADLGVELKVPSNAHYRPRYNLAPTDEALIVLPGQLAAAHWGFRTRTHPLINARMETVDQRGLFQAALLSSHPETRGRCLVPADGFFEWVGAKGDRHPIWYHRADGKLLLFAGLYSVNKDGGLEFTVITTPANRMVSPVHDRMPALLSAENANAWLAHPDLKLLGPAPEDALVSTFVSDRVSSVTNDDPDCLIPQRPRGQMKLF
jgi:putative SOS response-associated peptidase YedK